MKLKMIFVPGLQLVVNFGDCFRGETLKNLRLQIKAHTLLPEATRREVRLAGTSWPHLIASLMYNCSLVV